jgi:hypothetical protein
MGTGALSWGVKRPEVEAEYSHTSCAEIKNGEAIHPLPHIYLWFGA